MFELYLLSIAMWMLIIIGVTICTKDKIIANGWLDGVEPMEPVRGLVTMVITCAIPVHRVIVCAGIISMARMTKEEYEEYQDEDDE